jgi:uncharacterized membrane protein
MDDRNLETAIGTLLRVGVLLAAAVVTIGGLLYLAQHYSQHVSYRTFETGGSDMRTISGIVRSAAHLQSEGLIQFGLLLLIATPIARVAFAAIGFALERDRLYVAVSLIVLAILAFSLMHAT